MGCGKQYSLNFTQKLHSPQSRTCKSCKCTLLRSHSHCTLHVQYIQGMQVNRVGWSVVLFILLDLIFVCCVESLRAVKNCIKPTFPLAQKHLYKYVMSMIMPEWQWMEFAVLGSLNSPTPSPKSHCLLHNAAGPSPTHYSETMSSAVLQQNCLISQNYTTASIILTHSQHNIMSTELKVLVFQLILWINRKA